MICIKYTDFCKETNDLTTQRVAGAYSVSCIAQGVAALAGESLTTIGPRSLKFPLPSLIRSKNPQSSLFSVPKFQIPVLPRLLHLARQNDHRLNFQTLLAASLGVCLCVSLCTASVCLAWGEDFQT